MPMAAIAVLGLSGCLPGPNALVVPLVSKGTQVFSYATDKALAREQEKIDRDAILAQAEASCVSRQFSVAECDKVRAKALWAIDLAERVQGVETVAQVQRDQQFKDSFRPDNLAKDMAAGAAGQAMMLETATLQPGAQASMGGASAPYSRESSPG